MARDKKTDKQYAVKKLDKAHIVKNDKVKYVMSERDALSRMNHPGIVKLYWTFRDNRSLCKYEDQYLCVVLSRGILTLAVPSL